MRSSAASSPQGLGEVGAAGGMGQAGSPIPRPLPVPGRQEEGRREGRKAAGLSQPPSNYPER